MMIQSGDSNNLLGLEWKWRYGELYIFNGSKYTIFVSFPDGGVSLPSLAVGGVKVYQITTETNLVTLSYYTEKRDLMIIFLRDTGSWTTTFTPMLPSSCYTNDRWGAGLMTLTRRRVWRVSCVNDEEE